MKHANNRILLVEDNPDDVILTQRAFQKSNVTNDIVVAHDGQEALDYLFEAGVYAGRGGQLPELVLLDINLPHMDGIEVLRRIRADPRTEFLPVVMLTTSSEDQDLVRSYQLGANSYVLKPVDFSHFVEAARELGLYWLLLNQRPRMQGRTAGRP